MELGEKELKSVKRSYFNILSLFLSKEHVQSKYVACLLKWSAQLNLTFKDLHYIEENFDHLEFKVPDSKVEKMEAIYHLVHMIYIDNVVEDIELEVATIYASKLGFDKSIVGELFKAIATAPFDGKTTQEVKKEVEDFIKMHEKS